MTGQAPKSMIAHVLETWGIGAMRNREKTSHGKPSSSANTIFRCLDKFVATLVGQYFTLFPVGRGEEKKRLRFCNIGISGCNMYSGLGQLADKETRRSRRSTRNWAGWRRAIVWKRGCQRAALALALAWALQLKVNPLNVGTYQHDSTCPQSLIIRGLTGGSAATSRDMEGGGVDR